MLSNQRRSPPTGMITAETRLHMN